LGLSLPITKKDFRSEVETPGRAAYNAMACDIRKAEYAISF
jgi:hypothetical protein